MLRARRCRLGLAQPPKRGETAEWEATNKRASIGAGTDKNRSREGAHEGGGIYRAGNIGEKIREAEAGEVRQIQKNTDPNVRKEKRSKRKVRKE